MTISARWVWLVALATSCQTNDRPAAGSAAAPAGSADVSTRVSTLETPAPAAVASPAPPPVTRAPVPPLPSPLPGVRTDVTALVGDATRVAIGDLDGDGRPEIALADRTQLRVVSPTGTLLASAPVAGGIEQLVIGDADGDGHLELLAGWGETREHRDAKTRITLHRLVHGTLTEEVVTAPDTTRNNVEAIVPMPDRKAVLLAYFDSKYMVTAVVATRRAGGWTTETIARLRTATSFARGDVDGDGTPDLIVGRVYGDAKAADGDAFLLRPDGARVVIPSTRGMRSIAVADLDGDGRAELYLGDGWHANYGANAEGLLTQATFANGAFTSRLVDNTPGQYALEPILPATIDGKRALVAVGNEYVRVYWRDGDRWDHLAVAGRVRAVAVGDLDGKPGDELVLIGDHAEIVNLASALHAR